MSKLTRLFACAALIAGLALALPGAAQARHWHDSGCASGVVLGSRIASGAAYVYPPSHYRPPPAYYPPRNCDWVSERYWWHGRWHWRRVWRCW